ncbi:hypothetical protein [Bacteroides sp. 224]|uniref:hypothetical protein n=1 Tax=Bacteroides sp. 224 TaxID=2302936 RepID=UPI0013D28B74|nr:hypothetical protein [Bacteroides sp. 224]
MNKLLFVFTILFASSCYGVQQEKLPQGILDYINSHEEFKLLTIDDLRLLDDYVNLKTYYPICFGDFNRDQKEDAGLILKHNGLLQLVIFNSYKESVKPTFVYKTGIYKEINFGGNQDDQSVIFEHLGMLFSVIHTGENCGIEVIDIVIPEKSAFFVYWDSRFLQYRYLNYLDDEYDCETISKQFQTHTSEKDLLGRWYTEEGVSEPNLIISDVEYPSIEIAFNQFVINLQRSHTNNDVIYYKFSNIDGAGALPYSNVEFDNNEPIAEIKQISKDRILFKWLGFCKKETKERIYTENLFHENLEEVMLVKLLEY